MSSIDLHQPYLTDSIREVKKSSWLISDALLLTLSPSSLPDNIPIGQVYWGDSNGGHFALSPAPEPLPDSKPLLKTHLLSSKSTQSITRRQFEGQAKP
jgi:hypothetical protein